MEKIRLGIIGIGNMGSSHAKKVVEGKCPDFVLTAIADINEERHTWVKEALGEEIKCYDCKGPGRICRGLTVLWGPMMVGKTEILLIDEDLGM